MTRPHGGWRLLVVAKAPVPGLAKTRLAATIGDVAAADVAAAALLDTLDAAAGAVGPARCVAAVTGDLGRAARGDEIAASLHGWTVVAQRGHGFDERLAHAHADAGPGAVVQVGMDTPQLTSQLLTDVAARLTGDAVLAPAADGGWWVLGLRDPAAAAALRGVRMSTPTTYDDTRRALRGGGLTVGSGPVLTDVDTAADADEVARLVPEGRFARAWARARTAAA